MPILRERGLPAAAFVVAGVVGSSRPFWWTEVIDLASHGGTVRGLGPTSPAGSRPSAEEGAGRATASRDRRAARDRLRGAEAAGAAVGRRSPRARVRRDRRREPHVVPSLPLPMHGRHRAERDQSMRIGSSRGSSGIRPKPSRIPMGISIRTQPRSCASAGIARRSCSTTNSVRPAHPMRSRCPVSASTRRRRSTASR